MIDNPRRSFEKQHNLKIQKHWWQRIKALLFGQWLLSKENENTDFRDNLKLLDFEKHEVMSTHKDWMQAIDVLQPLVQSIRKDIEPRKSDEFDLDLLAANTYLFHVDRLITKIREYLHQFRFRQEQSSDSSLYAYKVELNQASAHADQCHQSILQITVFLQRTPRKKLYSEELIAVIHALELDTTALGSTVRNLNQSAYKAESMIQLAALEHDLLQSLTQSRTKHNAGFADNSMHFNMSQSQDEYLRSTAQRLTDPVLQKMLIGFIDIHEQLKKCYVVARKIIIKDALESMGAEIEKLTVTLASNEIDTNKVFLHLNRIFHQIETVRFNSNRESRCSKNLFDKSRVAAFQLRKLCQKHPLGLEYLKQYAAKRVTLVKPK